MKKDEFREKVFLLDFMKGYQDQERSVKRIDHLILSHVPCSRVD